MKIIRSKQAEVIKNIALDAVREALESEGLNILVKGMVWSDGKMDLTITFILPDVLKVVAQQKTNEARKLCSKFDLPPDMFARELYLYIERQAHTRVKVVDIKPRNHKYPIIVEVFDHSSRYHGKRFKIQTWIIREALKKS